MAILANPLLTRFPPAYFIPYIEPGYLEEMMSRPLALERKYKLLSNLNYFSNKIKLFASFYCQDIKNTLWKVGFLLAFTGPNFLLLWRYRKRKRLAAAYIFFKVSILDSSLLMSTYGTLIIDTLPHRLNHGHELIVSHQDMILLAEIIRVEKVTTLSLVWSMEIIGSICSVRPAKTIVHRTAKFKNNFAWSRCLLL